MSAMQPPNTSTIVRGLCVLVCLCGLAATSADESPVVAGPERPLLPPAPAPAAEPGTAAPPDSLVAPESPRAGGSPDAVAAPASVDHQSSQPLPESPGGGSDHDASPAGASTTAPGAALDGPRARDSLDSDLVYSVLVAEVAARRGDMAMAFTHYLHAAQLARDAKMAELAVRTAMTGQDDAGAGRAVALWLELAPDALGANQIAALLRLKAGDREGALTHLSRVIRLADAESGYVLATGIIGRVPSAPERLGLMRTLVEMDESNADAQQALATVAASVEQNDVAAAAARRALELRPGWDKPRQFLVRLLLSQGKRSEARALIEEFVAASPNDNGLRMLYGQFLVEEKDYSSARGVFQSLLDTRPKDPDVLFALGVLSLELEDLDAARDYMTRLYQTGQRQDEASFYLGQVEERGKHPDTAINWYGKTQGAYLLDAQIRVAVLRAKAGEVERAREVMQQLRDQAPDAAPTLFLAEAEILDQAGRQDGAMQVYAAALKAFPDDTDLLYGRAMYAVKLDRVALAESDLRQIIDRNPEHADALNALGYTLADRTDRYQEALGYVERAYKLKPDEPAVLDSVGWVNYKLGHFDVALEYLNKASDAMKDGEIAAHLGEVLWAMGRQDEARAVWEAALKDHPGHAYLQEVVGRHRVTQRSETLQ